MIDVFGFTLSFCTNTQLLITFYYILLFRMCSKRKMKTNCKQHRQHWFDWDYRLSFVPCTGWPPIQDCAGWDTTVPLPIILVKSTMVQSTGTNNNNIGRDLYTILLNFNNGLVPGCAQYMLCSGMQWVTASSRSAVRNTTQKEYCTKLGL